MKKVQNVVAQFPGLVVLHQKIPGHEVGHHKHAEHEFFLPLQGEITIDYEMESVKTGPGRMLYVPPNLEHTFSSSARGSGERVIWLIEDRIWRQHSQKRFLPAAFPINSLAKELVFHLLIHQGVSGAKHFISALVETSIDSLVAAQIEKRRVASGHILGRVVDQRVRRSIEVIEADLGAASLAEVPKQSGLSPRNFSRLFLRETGLTPKEFLTLRRVDRAKELLATSRMTVTDVSMEVGYNSLSKFIAAFKRVVGCLPSDYRSGLSVNGTDHLADD